MATPNTAPTGAPKPTAKKKKKKVAPKKSVRPAATATTSAAAASPTGTATTHAAPPPQNGRSWANTIGWVAVIIVAGLIGWLVWNNTDEIKGGWKRIAGSTSPSRLGDGDMAELQRLRAMDDAKRIATAENQPTVRQPTTITPPPTTTSTKEVHGMAKRVASHPNKVKKYDIKVLLNQTTEPNASVVNQWCLAANDRADQLLEEGKPLEEIRDTLTQEARLAGFGPMATVVPIVTNRRH